ncbi:hypothetical protein Bpfe_012414, partial [Biomphalaria pfeifferi]
MTTTLNKTDRDGYPNHYSTKAAAVQAGTMETLVMVALSVCPGQRNLVSSLT